MLSRFLCHYVDPLHLLVLAPLVSTEDPQARQKSDKDQALDSGAAPLPANVVEEQTRQTCPKETANCVSRRPERGDKGVGGDVVWESRQLPGGVEGAGVGSHKDGASSETEEHQTHQFQRYARGKGYKG